MKDLSNKEIIHIKKGDMQYLQFRRLLEYEDKIKHLYTIGLDKSYRTSKGEEEKQQSIRNYEDITKCLEESSAKVVKLNQIHSDITKVVNEKIIKDNVDIYENADAVITDKKDIMLATTNADCIIVLIYDIENNCIGNVHSGWRGTSQRIILKTIEEMTKKYGSKPENLLCTICPSIRMCHFEVTKEVREIFEKEFKDFTKKQLSNIIVKQETKEKWNIDTVLINKILLKQIGVKEENIIDSNICSVCNQDLIHSYRAHKENFGLNTALIMLK